MEANEGAKVQNNVEKAIDPSKKPSERADAAHEAGKAAQRQDEHACKADRHAEKAKH